MQDITTDQHSINNRSKNHDYNFSENIFNFYYYFILSK